MYNKTNITKEIFVLPALLMGFGMFVAIGYFDLSVYIKYANIFEIIKIFIFVYLSAVSFALSASILKSGFEDAGLPIKAALLIQFLIIAFGLSFLNYKLYLYHF